MSNPSRKIPIIVCFDVEPDLRLIQREKKAPWLGYEQLQPFLEELRPRLAEATQSPVHYSWYFRLDQQIELTYGSAGWPLKTYEKLVRKSEAEGDEIGIHPHTYKWDEALNEWVAIHDNIPYSKASIELSVKTYHDFFHRSCRSLRMGDKWINNETIDLAEKLGLKYDLTLEPGHEARSHVIQSEYHTGALPSFVGIPQKSYQPSRGDFRKPDSQRKEAMWMIPLSSEKIGGWVGVIQRFSRQVLRGKNEQKYLTLNFEMKPWIFKNIAEQILKKTSPAYLAAVSRTSVAIDDRQNLLANWDYLLRHPLRKQFVIARPDEALKILNELSN